MIVDAKMVLPISSNRSNKTLINSACKLVIHYVAIGTESVTAMGHSWEKKRAKNYTILCNSDSRLAIPMIILTVEILLQGTAVQLNFPNCINIAILWCKMIAKAARISRPAELMPASFPPWM